MIFLDFNHEGALVALDDQDVETVLVTQDDARAAFAAAKDRGEVVYRSSSLDCPEEYTSDPQVLALVAFINAE